MKRIFDIVSSLIALIVFSPVVLFICFYIIVTESKSPIFVQERIGRCEKTFYLIKIRTMYEGVITPIGKILRKYRIDEIPNFINILRGDMSFIGPRPETVINHYKLCKKYADWPLRTSVKPGLTGLAQVTQGHINPITSNSGTKLELDLTYIRNGTWTLDLEIIIKTIKVIIGGSGK